MHRIKDKAAVVAVSLAGLCILLLLISFFFKSEANYSDQNEKEWTLEQLLEETLEGEGPEAGFETEAESRASELSKEELIFVDIKGAVTLPGVYQMQKGQRIIDALQNAGGLLEEADSITVNFSEVLRDEMLIYIPFKGEELVIHHIEERRDAPVLIDLNSATFDELIQLSGIGPAKAQAIIAYREENGQFMTTDEIKQVSGIGDKTFENLQEQITVH